MKEADYYNKLDSQKVQCILCPHSCTIADGKAGLCRVRRNQGGTLYAESFGKITSIALDPIEKKPLYHFYPGSRILSIGSYGCNFKCGFCQNHEISMGSPAYRELSPAGLVKMSKEAAQAGNIGAAYTYNEPFISAEYLKECAEQIHKQGQKNVVVTNGFVCGQVLEGLLPFIDAVNIDLKGFQDIFYQKLGGNIAPVKKSIELAAAACHVEVTALIIPGENDSEAEMQELSAWIAGVDKKIPLHISRFFPAYRYFSCCPTPEETIYRLADAAGKHLEYVYLGNC